MNCRNKVGRKSAAPSAVCFAALSQPPESNRSLAQSIEKTALIDESGIRRKALRFSALRAVSYRVAVAHHKLYSRRQLDSPRPQAGAGWG